MSPAQLADQSDDERSESRVLIISTGGTICMQEGPDGLAPSEGFLETAMAPRSTFNDNLNKSAPNVQLPAFRNGDKVLINSLRTPQTAHKRHIRYGLLEFSPLLDSSSISALDWAAMAAAVEQNYALFDGFVILHGTDSLAYTASALSFILTNLGKPVILTGSQAPIFALQSDAVDNLLGSLVIAGTFIIPEVCLFFHNKLYRGNRTTKVSSASFEAFASPNCEPLAQVNGLGIDVRWSLVLRPTSIASFCIHGPHLDTTHVACIRVFPGIKPEMVDAVLRLPDIRGLILETFGMGNVPGGGPDGPLTKVLQDAVNRGVVVVNVSQCVSGFASPRYAPGTHLGRAGVIFGLDITPEAALAKLSYLLSLPEICEDPAEVAARFSKSLRGEMTEFVGTKFSHPTDPLLDAAATCLKPNEAAFTALGYAIRQGETGHVRQLLDTDAGPELVTMADYAGNTALHVAAVSGSPAIMLELLKRGASVHERNRAGNSPLLLAALSANKESAKLLRAAGAHLTFSELEREPLAESFNQD